MGCKIRAVSMDYEICKSMGHDVISYYENIKSSIPGEFRVPMEDDDYILIEEKSGKINFLGKSWIKPNGLTVVADTETTIVIKGNDVNTIRTLLAYGGIEILSMEVKNKYPYYMFPLLLVVIKERALSSLFFLFFLFFSKKYNFIELIYNLKDQGII